MNRALPRANSLPQLADRFEERQAFDIADRAADLAQAEIFAVRSAQDEILDRVGDMRNDLNRGAQIIAAPFLGEMSWINRPVVTLSLPRSRPPVKRS